jgi:hypothetical protein
VQMAKLQSVAPEGATGRGSAFMEILRNLRRLESSIAKTVNEATYRMTRADSCEPLEILHAIVDGVEKRVEPAGRGKYVFPFDRIHICIAAATAETRARFEAVLASPPALQDRIVERLETSGCEWTGLSISTTFAERSESEWTTPYFNIEFDRVNGLPQPEPPVEPLPSSLRLTVARGVTDKPVHVFTTSYVNLGRCPEVRDSHNRLIRTNHVAFSENAGEPNPSVSRNHAHIDRTEKPAEYRLYDDRSAHGTSVVRKGQTIAVPPGPRGVRLQSGDEIILGEACLHVEIEIGTHDQAAGSSLA